MAVLINMVQNDTAPSRVFVVKRNGAVVDLTGATVKFKIKDDSTASRTNDAHNTCTLTDAVNGKVTYTFQTGDLPDASTYTCELEITDAAGKIETYPNIIINALAED